MNEKIGNLALAPTGGILGAIIGGVLWAKFISQLPPPFVGILTASIGLFCGLGVMLMSKERGWIPGIIAAIFTIFGILLCEYLYIRWNFISQVTEQIMQQHEGITRETALEYAKIQRSGMSTRELIIQRVRNNLFPYIGTVIIGFLTAWSHTLYGLLRRK